MKYPNNPSYNDDNYVGCVTAGRATGRPIPPPSEDDLRALEAAWNDPAFYEFVKDEGYVAAGLPAGASAAPITAEELRQLEVAWNNTAAYNAAVMAYYQTLAATKAQNGASEVTQPTVESSATEPPCGVLDESVSAPH